MKRCFRVICGYWTHSSMDFVRSTTRMQNRCGNVNHGTSPWWLSTTSVWYQYYILNPFMGGNKLLRGYWGFNPVLIVGCGSWIKTTRLPKCTLFKTFNKHELFYYLNRLLFELHLKRFSIKDMAYWLIDLSFIPIHTQGEIYFEA